MVYIYNYTNVFHNLNNLLLIIYYYMDLGHFIGIFMRHLKKIKNSRAYCMLTILILEEWYSFIVAW